MGAKSSKMARNARNFVAEFLKKIEKVRPPKTSRKYPRNSRLTNNLPYKWIFGDFFRGRILPVFLKKN